MKNPEITFADIPMEAGRVAAHANFPIVPADRAHAEAGKPWVHEPNVVLWIGCGLPCAISRGPSGALCGYVAVTPGHPLHGVCFSDADRIDAIDAHGGLSFSDNYCPSRYWNAEIMLNEGGAEVAVVLRDYPETEPETEPAKTLWWFGFDCGRIGDLTPVGSRVFDDRDWRYRDMAYVRDQCHGLAEALARMAPVPGALSLLPS